MPIKFITIKVVTSCAKCPNYRHDECIILALPPSNYCVITPSEDENRPWASREIKNTTSIPDWCTLNDKEIVKEEK